MASFRIQGPAKLSGTIGVAGAKNHALKLIAASLLSSSDWIIHNVPDIEDIRLLLEIIEHLGCSVQKDGSTVTINAKNVTPLDKDDERFRKLRSSVLLTAPLLSRFGRMSFPHPGGCIIGRRPIDIFLDGFRAFGIQTDDRGEHYDLVRTTTADTTFVFPRITVTGTETMLMLAARTPGTHMLINVAVEPEVCALAQTLSETGAEITGIGTPTLTVKGTDQYLTGIETTVLPDRLEAGTFIMLAAATHSGITIENCRPEHLDVPLAVLRSVGVTCDVTEDTIAVHPSQDLKAVNMTTHEYPGFVTDLQAPFTVLMTQADGMALIHETIYEGRLFFTDKLNRMGANILLADPHRAIVNGPTPLRGKVVESPDIRAGIALVIAALVAEGESVIENAYQIDRGYERIEERLKAIGATIERVDE